MNTYSVLKGQVSPGIVTGDNVQVLFDTARRHQFAYPAVNVIGTNSVNAALDAEGKVNALLSFSCPMAVRVFFGQRLKA